MLRIARLTVTDGRTDGQLNNIMPAACNWGRNIKTVLHVHVKQLEYKKDSANNAQLQLHTDPLKGRRVNWLHFAIHV